MPQLSPREWEAFLRNDFEIFLRQVFRTLCPGQDYVPGWHISAIAHQLKQVQSGELKRLVINMPPRSLKSIAASVALPAFLLGHDPTLRIICVSYSNELARKLSNDFRAVLSSDWYRRVFPSTRIGPYKDTETEIELTKRGYRLATSIGGTLTGRGGDIVIIDDPLKASDALSDTKRNLVNDWFNNTLLSRLDNKLAGAIILVMQRVHMHDLSGFVLAQPGWTHLCLPAIAEHDEVIPIGGGRVHHRHAGDPLVPQREPLAVLEQLRSQLGADLFSAQYQQAPVPPGGAMIKRVWVQRYDELPPKQQGLMIFQSWDTAAKGGPDNDWSVCTTWQLTRDRQWYLLHVWRGRLDYPGLKKQVVALAQQWKAGQVLIEEAGVAIGLIQEVRKEIRGVKAVKPERDKVSRLSQASLEFETGRVFFPRSASWLAVLEAELFAFPGSPHDDQVDSISQALLSGPADLAVWTKLAGPRSQAPVATGWGVAIPNHWPPGYRLRRF